MPVRFHNVKMGFVLGHLEFFLKEFAHSFSFNNAA